MARPRANWAAIGGIALFAAVVVLLLASGPLRRAAVGGPRDVAANVAGTGASAPAASPAPAQEPAQWQRELLDALSEKFPEALANTARGIADDGLFLAAAGKASYENPVFDDYGVTVTLLLPDPRKGSLDKLGIGRYAPYSGARAYIRENYEKLRRMDTPDSVEYPVTFFFQTGAGGEKTLDWALLPIYQPLYEYSKAFEPHVRQFMADRGFHDAAREILLPDFEDAASAAYLREYFADLAGALEFEGIEADRETLVDREKIERILATRFARAWAADAPSFDTDLYAPYFILRAPESFSLFWGVCKALDAQRESGTLAAPASLEALEDIYLSAARAQIDELLGGEAGSETVPVVTMLYSFSWEELGASGISACPHLVDEVRSFLYAYDYGLMFLAKSFDLVPS